MKNIKRQIEHRLDCLLARIMIQILCYYRMVFIKFRGEGPKFKNPIFYESLGVFVFLRKSICDTWVSYIFHCGRMPGVSNLKEEGLTLTHGSGDFSPSKLRGTKLTSFHQDSPEAEKRHGRN